MLIDVWIYGPGFGESILLIWDADSSTSNKPRRQAAIIDCYGGRHHDDHQALRQWSKEGKPDVVFVAVTHPHLDHIRGAGVVMRAAAHANLKRAVWWGGHDLRRTRLVYDHASKVLAAKSGTTEQMTTDYLDTLLAIQDGVFPATDGPPSVDSAMESSVAYSGHSAAGRITFCAISPWVVPQIPYTQWLDDKARGTTSERVANCTSLGFLIECGHAQILLGGDVEKDNWDALRGARVTEDRKYKLPTLKPCLIKVSHHGSSTGYTLGMWDQYLGFFGSLDGGGERPHCVITPWRLGPRDRHLPDPRITDKIAKAGCHVWTTASDPIASGIDRSTHLSESYIHFTVDSAQNRASMVDQRFCAHKTPAVTP